MTPPTVASAPAVETPNKLLTAAEVADRWQVPSAHVYRLAREGRLPTVKLGRYRRWRAADLDAFEAEGGCDGP